MPTMATLECNNGQDGFSPKENGNSFPEEKSLNIDYSEDLWLANSEDSSGSYAQQPTKVVPHDSSGTYSCQSEVRTSYSSSFSERCSIDQHSEDRVKAEYCEPPTGNVEGQLWSGDLPESDTTTLQPAAHYVNGFAEQNGMEFQSGEGRDFAQLVPAGSYLENGGMMGVDNHDKTFTSLMPAAAVGGSDEDGDYTAMIGAHRQQMVYYSSGDHIKAEETSPTVSQDNVTISYSQSRQMTVVNGEESGSEEAGSNSVYISMDSLNANGQPGSPGGSFAVLSSAVMRMSSSDGSDQTYSSQLADCNYQHISTLPFVQNGAFSTQPSFSSFHSTTASTITNSNESQVHRQPDHTNFSSADGSAPTICASITPSFQPDNTDYPEEEDDDDEDQDDDINQDMEENSVEFSEFTCPVCNESFIDQAALEDHVTNHPPMKTFLCVTCNKGFATRRYLKYHRKNHCKRAGSYEGRNDLDENDPNGEIKRFTCNVCNSLFRVLKCMKVHKKKKHGILKEYTCQNCAVTFSSLQELTDHLCESKSVKVASQIPQHTPPAVVLPIQKKKRKLKNAKPCCDICGKTFSDRISVDIHRVKHIEEELSPCDMCCDEDDKAHDNHLAVHFRIRFFTDDNQHILEDQRAAVTSHDQSRSDDGSSVSATPVHIPGSATPQSAPATPVYPSATPTHPSGTSICTANTIISSDYAADLNDLTGGDQDQSGFTRPHSNFSENHCADGTKNFFVSTFEDNQSNCPPSADHSLLTSHQDELQLENSTAYNDDYTDGEIIQDASGSILAVTPRKKKMKTSKLHMCDICNKSFGDTCKLELHYKSNHLNDRPYQCDICDKSFFTKWKLQRHMLSHLEQKPHSCPMCSKSFVERGKLDAHYRTHLGTKPYKCDQCPKTFTVKSQLSIHQRRIHSTDQPFGCLVCGKAFLWKSGLDKHMRKHTREKPYICETCGIKYSNKANLIVHMSKAHNQKYVDKS